MLNGPAGAGKIRAECWTPTRGYIRLNCSVIEVRILITPHDFCNRPVLPRKAPDNHPCRNKRLAERPAGSVGPSTSLSFGVRRQSGTSVLRVFPYGRLVAPNYQPARARRRFGFQATRTKAPSPRCMENVTPPIPG